MFTVIEPNALSNDESESHAYHKSDIKALLSLLKSYQRFELPFDAWNKVHFLIADNRENGVYGGAVLYCQSITCRDFLIAFTSNPKDKNLAKNPLNAIEDIFSLFPPERETIWAARFCLRVNDKTFPLTSEVFEYHENFYEELLRYFCAFGEKEGIDYLALTLQARDYTNTRTYGWPYVFETKPRDSIDRLFHGFLALQAPQDLIKYHPAPFPLIPANNHDQTDRPVL